MNTPDTPQRVNTTLTHKTGDGTNLFDSSQRDVTPTPLDQSMEDHTTTTQRVRIASPLTPRREPNLFETVQNLSKQNRQGISFNQLPQPRRRLFIQTPSIIGDSSLLTPSPGSVRPVRTYSPTTPANDYFLLTPVTVRRQTHYT